MAIPTNRTPVRVARGEAVKFTETINGVAGAGAKELQDGEIIWDETNEKFQIKYGGSTSTTLKDHTVASDTTKADTNSPNLTGIPTSTTAAVSTDSTQIATTAFVVAEIGDEVGKTVQAYDADTAKSDAIQTWTKPQRGAIYDATSDAAASAGWAIDFDKGNNQKVTLAATSVLSVIPANQTVGQSGSIFITQPGSPLSLGWHADWKWAGGVANAPSLTQTGGATDRLDYVILAANTIHAVLTLAVA